MKDRQDAYGHQLYDFYKGRKVLEVVERDDGLIDPSETLPKYYLSEYKNWNPREKIAARYVRGRVLDVGCGGGRWSLFLKKKGHDVLGIDISPLAVKVCKERGLRNVIVKSISDVDSSLGKFDTILMMGNNFGLFGNPKQTRRLLKRFYHTTNPGARIIAESLDIYKPPVDPVHRQYHLRNRRRGRMPGQVRIRIRYLTYTSPWFDYLLVSKPEMIGLLRGTGWKIGHFIPSKKGPRMSQSSRKRLNDSDSLMIPGRLWWTGSVNEVQKLAQRPYSTIRSDVCLRIRGSCERKKRKLLSET